MGFNSGFKGLMKTDHKLIEIQTTEIQTWPRHTYVSPLCYLEIKDVRYSLRCGTFGIQCKSIYVCSGCLGIENVRNISTCFNFREDRIQYMRRRIQPSSFPLQFLVTQVDQLNRCTIYRMGMIKWSFYIFYFKLSPCSECCMLSSG